MLNNKQISFYEENGNLIVDNILSEDDLRLVSDNFNEILDAIIDRAKLEYQNIF